MTKKRNYNRMNFKRRTHTCGELKAANAGEKVVLNGWVDRRRDLGGVIFIGLRDRYGVTQVIFEPEHNQEAHQFGKELRNEFVVSVEGTVRERPKDQVNKEMTTGEIDIIIEKLIILNEAETPPFPIKDEVDAFEDLRLKYRYLDLRRPVLQKTLLLRHHMYQLVRKYFDKNSFLEIETPVLMKSTPEGARDYLVPSRIHKGKFYALPQSPQTYKQLLMVSGFDRYFQIVKCFRDEDQRADRQPEFTQIDVEMSFVDIDDVFEIVEGLMKVLFKDIWQLELRTPIPRLTFNDALEKYGSDKPDLRFDLELKTLNRVFENSGFKVFKRKLVEKLNATNGDLILILAGKRLETLTQMGGLRLEMAKRLELVNPDSKPKLLWVTDFPLLEWDEETKRFYAMHHPFTSPRTEDIELLDSDPGKVKARAYDLVLNGHEIAGGSIRIHNSELQAKMFKTLGILKEEAEKKFGFLMNAFKFGAPPHGGIAFGFDRMVMIFAGETSIRDTIAFPKTTSAISLMDESPSEVSDEQLKELHIKLREKKGNKD
jgi:aspartyl-tRNA synthetase